MSKSALVPIPLVILLIVLFFISADTGPMTLTFSGAYALALQNNSTIKMAEQDVKVSEAALSESEAAYWMPTLQLTGNLNILTPETASSGNTFSTALTVQKSLFDAFTLGYNVEIARAKLALSKATLSNVRNNLAVTVFENYYGYLIAEQTVKSYQSGMNTLNTQLDSLNALYANGQATELDVLTAKVALENYRPKLLKATSDLDTNRIELMNLMGVEQTAQIMLTDTIDSLKSFLFDTGDKKALLEKAEKNDLSLMTIETTKKQYEIQLSNLVLQMAPSLSAGTSVSYKIGSSTNPFLWTVSLQLIWNIDSILPFSEDAYAEKQLNAQITKQTISSDSRKTEIATTLDTLLKTLEYCDAVVKSQLQNLADTERGLAIVTAEFNAGLRTIVDPIDWGDKHLTAQLTYWQALYDYAHTVLQLKALIGSVE